MEAGWPIRHVLKKEDPADRLAAEAAAAAAAAEESRRVEAARRETVRDRDGSGVARAAALRDLAADANAKARSPAFRNRSAP